MASNTSKVVGLAIKVMIVLFAVGLVLRFIGAV